MKITFLGTGTSQGIPVITCNCDVCQSGDEKDKRLRTSVLIETESTNIVIDTGPDFRQQMLREKVKKLDAVMFTHEHKDHISGLDDIRSYNYVQQKPMDVYAQHRVLEALKQEFSYVFSEYKYPGIPKVILHEINTNAFKINDVKITPIPVIHLKLPILGYRIGNFGYITDANFIPEESKALLKGLDVLVINALRIKKHISHFNLTEALAVVDELKPQKAFLTHISHYLGKHEEILKMVPRGVEPAYDGLVISI